MRWISSSSKSMPRIRFTSERCNAMDARSACGRQCRSVRRVIRRPRWRESARLRDRSQRRNAPVSARSKRCDASVCMRCAWPCCAPSPGRRPCRLDEHVLRPLGDHGVEAAHDTGQRHRLLFVSDDEVPGRELAVHAVERLEHLAFAGAPDDDGAASSRSRSKAWVGWPSSLSA